MTFDPAQLEQLAQFARELTVPESQSFDAVQQARIDDAEIAREALRREIEDLERQLKQVQEVARQAGMECVRQLRASFEATQAKARNRFEENRAANEFSETSAQMQESVVRRTLDEFDYYLHHSRLQQLRRQLNES